jgi:hypothetical protein
MSSFSSVLREILLQYQLDSPVSKQIHMTATNINQIMNTKLIILTTYYFLAILNSCTQMNLISLQDTDNTKFRSIWGWSQQCVLRLWSSRSLHHSRWLYTNVLEEHAASILRAKVRKVRNSMDCIRLGQRSGQEHHPWMQPDTHFLLIQSSSLAALKKALPH